VETYERLKDSCGWRLAALRLDGESMGIRGYWKRANFQILKSMIFLIPTGSPIGDGYIESLTVIFVEMAHTESAILCRSQPSAKKCP
jgi:hypothetical protein